MNKKPSKEMIEAWNKRAKLNWNPRRKSKNKPRATLGVLAGGCPKCGHFCSFDDKKFHCYRENCGWDWSDEK